MLPKVGSNQLKTFNPLKQGEGSPATARPSRLSGMKRVHLILAEGQQMANVEDNRTINGAVKSNRNQFG